MKNRLLNKENLIGWGVAFGISWFGSGCNNVSRIDLISDGERSMGVDLLAPFKGVDGPKTEVRFVHLNTRQTVVGVECPKGFRAVVGSRVVEEFGDVMFHRRDEADWQERISVHVGCLKGIFSFADEEFVIGPEIQRLDYVVDENFREWPKVQLYVDGGNG